MDFPGVWIGALTAAAEIKLGTKFITSTRGRVSARGSTNVIIKLLLWDPNETFTGNVGF